jgi:hypothetical protein
MRVPALAPYLNEINDVIVKVILKKLSLTPSDLEGI